MPMRLLSFLTEIERAIVAESSGVEASGWTSKRMMNFHRGLARLTLQSRPESQLTSTAGSVFLQAFTLADGSTCLKATLGWGGHDNFADVAVYSTPTTDWKLEASRVGSAWLNGPRAHHRVSMTTDSLTPLAVAAS
jgi:hypothetical protein